MSTRNDPEDRKRDRSPEPERESKRPRGVCINNCASLSSETMEVETKPKQPADLEELIETQKNEEGGAKPKFLTKAERRALALQKRQEEVAAKQKLEEEERLYRQHFFAQTKAEEEAARDKAREERRGGGRGDPRDRHPRDRDDRDRRDRDRRDNRDRDDRDRRDNRDRDDRRDRDRRNKDDRDRDRDREREKEREKKEDVDPEKTKVLERELIKKEYMGLKERKKRFVKPSEKFKFNFEWGDDEDTSADLNPLYNKKFEARPALGRGYIGGVDKREQLARYQELVKQDKKKSDSMAVEGTDPSFAKQLTALEKAEFAGRHWSEKKLSEMTPRDWRIFKEDFNIATKGGGLPPPLRKWDEGGLPEWLLTAIKDAKYEKPTAVQMQAVPIGLAGRDILGVAETGSGKTLAFLIPMLVYISKLPRMTKETANDGPYAVVMAPTRELAGQIAEDCQRFAKYNNYNTVLLVGGQSIDEQAIQLRKGCEIVIATPGRLNDCLDSHYIVLNQCNYVVLDEADRMIDMGFEPQILSVLDSMPQETLKSELEEEAERQEKDHRNKYRTTLMFSATMPPEVERLAQKYLRRPGVIYIGEVGKAVDRIQQDVLWINNENEKKRKLEQLLREGPPPPIMIFVNQRKTCDTISKYLGTLGYKCTTLQGGRSQDQRDWALQEFKEGRSDVLVATDVAGRGIDVKGVTHVINYDMPKTVDQYTHRIGRTARAGTSGLATSFLTPEDTEIFYPLKKMLQDTGNQIPHELAHHPDAQLKPGPVLPKAKRDTVIYTS